MDQQSLQQFFHALLGVKADRIVVGCFDDLPLPPRGLVISFALASHSLTVPFMQDHATIQRLAD